MIYRTRGALIILTVILTSAAIFQVPVVSAKEFSSTDLIENAKALDGKEVVYIGEAVAAILARGEYSWINVNDGYNAIGVWSRSRELGSIKLVGGYKVRGDIIEIRGIFHRSCPVHGGELDIHADSVRILEPGYILEQKIDRHKLKISAVIFIGIILMAAVFRKRF